MAENSKIEWTKHTCNLWWGCTKVHAGCDHCYAETLSHRWDFDVWGNDKQRREIKSVWSDFKKYQDAAALANERHSVFVGSMMDIFEKPMPVISKDEFAGYSTGELRNKYFTYIVPYTPNLRHLMLTKRPSNIKKFIPDQWITKPMSNVMYGTSPCDQETFDILFNQLIKVPGKRFLSIEPMLGPIQMTSDIVNIDWVIVGGESGPGKRAMNLDWARSIRDQCLSAGVPFFMKQVDKVQPIPDDLMIRQFPN